MTYAEELFRALEHEDDPVPVLDQAMEHAARTSPIGEDTIVVFFRDKSAVAVKGYGTLDWEVRPITSKLAHFIAP